MRLGDVVPVPGNAGVLRPRVASKNVILAEGAAEVSSARIT